MSEILSRKEFEERKIADIHASSGEVSCGFGDAAATIEALADTLRDTVDGGYRDAPGEPGLIPRLEALREKGWLDEYE